jgi:hypothetical protein
MTQPFVAPAPPWLKFILWEDIFVVIDDGAGRPADYEVLHGMLVEQSSRYTAGLACLTIIPVDAKPPSQAARKAMNAALETAPLRCLCWLVEGSGFQAAMVRAVLTGLRVLGRPPYATHIAGDLEQALRWLLSNLDGGSTRIERAHEAAETIRAKRAAG